MRQGETNSIGSTRASCTPTRKVLERPDESEQADPCYGVALLTAFRLHDIVLLAGMNA